MRSMTAASTVTSRPVVGSSRSSSDGRPSKRHGDDDALLLAAGQLVRVALQHLARIGQPHIASAWRRPCHMASSRLTPRCSIGTSANCAPMVLTGFRRAHRVLIDHGDAATADGAQRPWSTRRPARVPSKRMLPPAICAVRAEIAHDGHRGRALAAAGFADEAVTLRRPRR